MIHLLQQIPRQQSTQDHILWQRFDQNSIFHLNPKRKFLRFLRMEPLPSKIVKP